MYASISIVGSNDISCTSGIYGISWDGYEMYQNSRKIIADDSFPGSKGRAATLLLEIGGGGAMKYYTLWVVICGLSFNGPLYTDLTPSLVVIVTSDHESERYVFGLGLWAWHRIT